jgi:formylglycine-generating enzyme required for sulfatase activity
VGSYSGSASPYGTFDQGGNVFQWNEEIVSYPYRGLRGGSYANTSDALASSYRGYSLPGGAGVNVGFRLVLIPEPGTGLLVIAGLLGLAGWRRASA